jgi:hypothetical protein
VRLPWQSNEPNNRPEKAGDRKETHTMEYFADTKSRIAAVHTAVYGSLASELTDWTTAERDQINAMAKPESVDGRVI